MLKSSPIGSLLISFKLMAVGSTYNLNTKSGDLSNVISIDNNLVSRIPSNKCLGVLLDEKLAFATHIEYICKKPCAGIGALRRIKPFVPLLHPRNFIQITH